MKKSQITIFLIIGIVILIILGLMLFFNSKNKHLLYNSNNNLDRQAEQIQKYLEQCLYDEAVKGIYFIGLQGGNIDPEYNESYGDYDQVHWQRSGHLKIPFWYYNGTDISPKIYQIENKMGRFILKKIQNCTHFEDMVSLKGMQILKPNLNGSLVEYDALINVSINDEDVSVALNYPILITSKNKQKDLSDLFVRIPIAFGNDFKITKKILDRMINSSTEYNIGSECQDFNRNSFTNVYSSNNKIKLIDYEPYFNKKLQKSFKIQFLYSDLNTYGYCSG